MEAIFNDKQINLDLDQLPPPVQGQDFSVKFIPADAGWQPVELSAGSQRTTFSASHLYDPFPDIIAWLELVINGASGSVRLNLEGTYLNLIASGTVREVRVTIAWIDENSAPVIDMDFVVERAEFCMRFYTSFREYVTSDRFDVTEWVYYTMETDLVRRGLTITPEDLAALDASTLNKFLWALYPRYEVSFGNATDAGDQARRFAEYVLSGVARDDLIETPAPDFVVPPEFDDWTVDERVAEIRGFFHDHVNAWHGADLTQLRSQLLEQLPTAGGSDHAKN